MSEKSREEQFKAVIAAKEKEKGLPDGLLFKLYDMEQPFLRTETRSEAVKIVRQIIAAETSDDIEKLKKYNESISSGGESSH